MVKRLLVLFTLVAMLLSGCGGQWKIKEENLPGKHLEHYDTLTALYGSGKMDTLKALGIDANNVDFVSGNNDYIDIRMSEKYAGIDLNIILFYVDSALDGVYNRKEYAYPDEMEQAISDVMQIGEQLAKDLGKPHGVDTWNDWYEEEYQVEMDQETPAYKSNEQIRAFLEGGLGGPIMSWDMTAVACDAVIKQGERFKNTDFVHYVMLNISRINDQIILEIRY